MAQAVCLSRQEAKQWEQRKGEDLQAYLARTEALLKELKAVSAEVDVARTLVSALVKFHVADGYAVYRVVKDRPLTLQHIPWGDAWRIPDAHLRGLRRKDILERVLADRGMAKLFGKR